MTTSTITSPVSLSRWLAFSLWVSAAAGFSFTSSAQATEGTISKTASVQPKTELLWPEGAPGALGKEEKDQPKLIIYAVSEKQSSGTAVVICPGGGYGHLAMDHEGHQIAQWFNSLGVSAFIADYRHRGKGYGHPAPLEDAQRAIRTVRSRAKEFHVKPDQIGILGFSAGGHLTSTAGTHFDGGETASNDPVQQVSCRPDFLVLCYPVISLVRDCTHKGSRKNLLGENPDEALVKSLSSELQVTKDTPPTFLFHTSGDTGVPPENSLLFYLALQKAGVPAELHVYEKGKHGLGLAKSTAGTADWSDRLANWLEIRGLIEFKP